MKYLFSGAVAAAAFALTALAAGCSDNSVPVEQHPADTAYIRFVPQEKFTFNYYGHDASDARVDSSKQVKVWTVLQTNQTRGDRSGVAVIEEVTYDRTGAHEMGQRDTFYMQATTGGPISQYNLLRSVVKRIPNAETFLDSVPPKWILIGNTKIDGDSAWNAIDGGKIANTVTVGSFTANVTLDWNAFHKGKRSVTVPAATYTSAYHTDHKLVITTASAIVNARDTFNIAYDFNATDGMLKQSLSTGKFLGSTEVDGFDMELVSVHHP